MARDESHIGMTCTTTCPVVQEVSITFAKWTFFSVTIHMVKADIIARKRTPEWKMLCGQLSGT